MKILDPNLFPATILGRECDHCRYRVEMRRAPSGAAAESSDVAKGAELARFLSFDLDYGSTLQRSDLCPRCADELINLIRPFLPSLRSIARRERNGERRGYEYQAIDGESGRIFSVASLIDDGA